MGIVKYLKTYEENILKSLDIKYKGLDWCELGDQIYYNGVVAKTIYQSVGVNHTSIDINGKHGALALDLSKPLSDKYFNKFDIITNYGTIEHVENQYECFKNVHNMLKIGGIAIHGVPFINNWPAHGRYYYSLDFFEMLARNNKYDIIDLCVLNEEFYAHPRNLVAAVLKKINADEFNSREEFNSIPILDSGNKKRTQNYTIK